MSETALLEPLADEAPTLLEPTETDEALYEVVHGERREIPAMSVYSARIATRLAGELIIFAKPLGIGEVTVEVLFRLPLAEDRHRNRRPDVAFVSFERWPADRPQPMEDNAWDVVPDLAVEVTSPNDLAEGQLEKVLEYFRAGVRLVWVVYPRLRLVHVFEAPGRIRVVTDAEALDGGPVLAGFSLPLAGLFDPAPPARGNSDPSGA